VLRADNLTAFLCRLSLNLGASTSWNPLVLHRSVIGLLYLLLINDDNNNNNLNRNSNPTLIHVREKVWLPCTTHSYYMSSQYEVSLRYTLPCRSTSIKPLQGATLHFPLNFRLMMGPTVQTHV